MSIISEDTRKQYLSDGYAILKSLLPVDELQSINEEINELYALQLRRMGMEAKSGHAREVFLSNASRLLQADVQTYIATSRNSQMLPSVHRLLISDPIMQLAHGMGLEFPVLSTRASIHVMSDELKVPGGYHKTPPHQDWRSIQGSLDNMVLWVPTTPVSENSHALEIVPKSHLMGLLPTVEHIMVPSVEDPRITEDKYVKLPVEPGDVIVFSSFMVHKTGEQGDGLARIALSGRFNNAAEPTYLKHGYPSPYSYSYRKDLIFEDFPTQADMETIFPEAE